MKNKTKQEWSVEKLADELKSRIEDNDTGMGTVDSFVQPGYMFVRVSDYNMGTATFKLTIERV